MGNASTELPFVSFSVLFCWDLTFPHINDYVITHPYRTNNFIALSQITWMQFHIYRCIWLFLLNLLLVSWLKSTASPVSVNQVMPLMSYVDNSHGAENGWMHYFCYTCLNSWYSAGLLVLHVRTCTEVVKCTFKLRFLETCRPSEYFHRSLVTPCDHSLLSVGLKF